jgi:hypothetical protein
MRDETIYASDALPWPEQVQLPLGDAAELTRGGSSGSSEDKRYVYA